MMAGTQQQQVSRSSLSGSQHHVRKQSRVCLPAVMLSAVRMWIHQWRRFVVLSVIAMLGVAVMTGIYAGCNDMLLATNAMYDRQRAHDIQIVSTLGLDDDDVQAVRNLDTVSDVEPIHSWQATAQLLHNEQASYAVNLIYYREATAKINALHLLEGSMPANNGEVAVTQRFLHDSGLRIGDSIIVNTRKPQAHGKKVSTRLTISASVLDSSDLSNPEGYQAKAFRSSVTSRYPFFTTYTAEPLTSHPYTSLLVRLTTTRNVNAFSQQYRHALYEGSKHIRDRVQAERERARRRIIVNQQIEEQTAAALTTQPMLKFAPRSVVEQARQEIQKRVRSEVERRVPHAQWHLSTRIANGSYASLRADVTSIQSLGYAFPAVFLLVAMMMSLTTMARMVEEERGLIGIYLSLGYGRIVAITRHAFFAILACLIGGGVGDVFGFLAIPSLLLKILRGLYVVPGIKLEYDWLYGSGCALAFVIPVAICTIIVSWRETRQVPAMLMLPKAPKAGARVLLERIGFIWNRISFLNKVTIRNLVRFKGRLLMTIGGVAGCTALIVCALALNDTVATLGVRQYEGIYHYDMMAVAAPDSYETMYTGIRKDQNNHAVQTILPAYVSSGEIAKVLSEHDDDRSHQTEESESVQLIVVRDPRELGRMVRLENVDASHKLLTLSDDGPVLSQSAAASLGIDRDSVVSLTNATMKHATIRVQAVVRNLIGSNVYMTARCYQRMFEPNGGKLPANNALLLQLRGSDDAKIRYADQVSERDGVVSVMNITRMKHSFSFDLMSAVVILIVALAGGLALAVLFTLATTNISERAREIATLKVLGFYKREVHSYVHKEMLTLTIIGIIIGLPLGRVVAGLLTNALRMPSLYFEVEVSAWSYVIAGTVTLVFALLVQVATNPALDRIDPVSSLKSVE